MLYHTSCRKVANQSAEGATAGMQQVANEGRDPADTLTNRRALGKDHHLLSLRAII